MITPGDIDDREPLKIKSFVEFFYGKIVGDKDDSLLIIFRRTHVILKSVPQKFCSNFQGTLRLLRSLITHSHSTYFLLQNYSRSLSCMRVSSIRRVPLASRRSA